MSRLSLHAFFIDSIEAPAFPNDFTTESPLAYSRVAPVRSLFAAARIGAFLLSGGAKGKRMALPNAEIMIHQPSGGARGQETEIRIVAENILKTRNKLNEILAANTGKSVEEIARDTERDNYMTAQEALAYGLIDSIVEKR